MICRRVVDHRFDRGEGRGDAHRNGDRRAPRPKPPRRRPCRPRRKLRTATPLPTATESPTATPTKEIIALNPNLGIVSVDELGGTYPRGPDIFDIGISDAEDIWWNAEPTTACRSDAWDRSCSLTASHPRARRGIHGQVADGGNGSEARTPHRRQHWLVPPVSPRLGAVGELRGGIE